MLYTVLLLSSIRCTIFCFFFFFNDTATTEIYTLSLHDALPIYEEIRVALLAGERRGRGGRADVDDPGFERHRHGGEHDVREPEAGEEADLVEPNVFLGDLAPDVGLELVVADQHFARHAAELAAV